MSIVLTVHDDELPPLAAAQVDAGLDAFNAGAAPLDQVRALACFVHDDRGTVLGGAVGRTWGACCELQQLWVDPAHRRAGLGRQLMQAFEANAQQRGCRHFYLETFSFQAPAFYAALGYRLAHRMDGFAPGISKCLMVRELPLAS